MVGMDTAARPTRLASIDAYRGFVMLLLLAECLRLGAVAEAVPESSFWAFLAFHQSHVKWAGCSLHDLIQPSFSFLVGVACVFSLAKRRANGRMRGGSCRPTPSLRAAVLVGLGVWLRFRGNFGVNWTFEDTLAQIGLGYPLLVWLGLRSLEGSAPGCPRCYPRRLLDWCSRCTPPAGVDFDWPAVGVPTDWPHHPAWVRGPLGQEQQPRPGRSTGGSSTCSRGTKPFAFNGGGYATLSFIPTLATMVLGLLAGRVLFEYGGRTGRTVG